MAFTFTSKGAKQAAADLLTSAGKIEEMLGTFEELIGSVTQNYVSEASEEIIESFNKVKSKGPEFQEAVAKCSKYLSDVVAPSYEEVESKAESKVTN